MALPLNQLSGMPQMGRAFAGWMKTITLEKIVQTITNGFAVDSTVPITFQGTIQPLSPKMLELKPEGMRAFEWLQIHCFATSANLTTGDKILYNGKRYKIMADNDYSLNNYIEYHAIFDYQDV